MFLRFIFIFLPFFAFSNSIDKYFSDLFSCFIYENNTIACEEILQKWELTNPAIKTKAAGLRAAICFAENDIERGIEFFNFYFEHADGQEKTQPLMKWVNKTVKKELSYKHPIKAVKRDDEYKQPPGVKTRYWLGVGQILAGILAMPFSPATGTTLIGTGASMVFSAACDALDNKEEFERDLQDRQRMNPDFQQNRLILDFYRDFNSGRVL